MTAPTHAAFGGFLYLLLLTTTGVALDALNAAAVVIGSVLPDIDTGASFVGRAVPLIARKIERRFGHRTLTHSCLGLSLLGILCTPVLLAGVDPYVCVLAGSLSHCLLDTCTPGGVRLFYPFSAVLCVFPFDVNAPGRYRVQTGSRLDRALGVIFLLGCLPTFYVARQGYERFIRVSQQSIETAVRDYTEFSRDNVVLASFEAHEMVTGRPVRGTFEVAGALNPHLLVVKGEDARLHALGRNFEAEYVCDHVICLRGGPAHVSAQTLDMSGQILGQLAVLVDTSADNFFFGELSTADRVSLPGRTGTFSPVTGSGTRIRLNFARLIDIHDLDLDFCPVAGGMVTVRTLWRNVCGNTSSHLPSGFAGVQKVVVLTFLVNAKETLSVMKRKGDTVRQGDVLATKTVPTFFDEERALDSRKLEQLRAHSDSMLRDLDRGIAASALSSRVDSLDCKNVVELVRRGFAVSSAKSELKWEKDRRTLQKLLAARQLLSMRLGADSARLHLAVAGTLAKARLSRLQSLIRSPLNGVVVDVRREPRDMRVRLVVIIRRIS